MPRILGCDLSLNHGAAVELVDGKIARRWFYTVTAGVASKKDGTRVPDFSKEDYHKARLMRLSWASNWLDEVLVAANPDYAGLEDYAIRAEQGAHYLGEIGGVARMAFWRRGIRFRLHDPTSLKLFVAWDGSADKHLVRLRCEERWSGGFDDYIVGKNRDTAEDLADALAIARLVEAEFLIRSGARSTRDLEHDQERRVFNRTTKTHPANLLDRDWIHSPTPSCSSVCVGGRCAFSTLDQVGVLSEKLKRQIARVVSG